MDANRDSPVGSYKWHIAIIVGVLIVIALLAAFTRVNVEKASNSALLLGSVIFIIAMMLMLSRVSGIVDTLRQNSAKMEEAAKALENIHLGLADIKHSTRVSETVKAIAFREEEKQSLREAVFDRLKDGNFDGAYEIIDEIGNHPGYRTLADELRQEVDLYRDSTEDQRLDQAIARVEALFESSHWAKASVEIEGLIRANPLSDKLRALRGRLIETKEQRKRALLTSWDEAVKRQETDRSLDILRELDMYLTPNEALALQEAARDAFRTKLHNLGVRFAMAVSDKHWTDALDVGQQIIRDFPNSRMSVEIREKLHVLQQNVQNVQMQNS